MICLLTYDPYTVQLELDTSVFSNVIEVLASITGKDGVFMKHMPLIAQSGCLAHLHTPVPN